MIIRLEFEDLNSPSTENTMSILYGSPTGGYCLDSENAKNITPTKVREMCGFSVSYWYLDVNILNKYYHGVLSALNNIQKMPGVKHVTILPYKDEFTSYDEIQTFIKSVSVWSSDAHQTSSSAS